MVNVLLNSTGVYKAAKIEREGSSEHTYHLLMLFTYDMIPVYMQMVAVCVLKVVLKDGDLHEVEWLYVDQLY